MPNLDGLLWDRHYSPMFMRPFHYLMANPRDELGPGRIALAPTSYSADDLKTADTLPESVYHRSPIWGWTHDPTAPSVFSDIRCQVRSMRFMPHLVCTKIKFQDPKVVFKGKTYRLPLTADFLLARYSTTGGHIDAKTTGLWQLEAEMDRSALLLFGYEFKDGTPGTPAKVTLDSKDLMPESTVEELSWGWSSAWVMVGQLAEVNTKPLRVIVAVELVCCKERWDFFPGSVVGMARLHPHVMLVSNLPLDGFSAEIGVHRPLKGSMAHGDPYAAMTDEIGAMFVADTNTNLLLANVIDRPLFDRFFDYFDVRPPVHPYVVVDPKKPARSAVGIITRPSRALSKVARQGAYDNLHLAPRMRAPAQYRNDPRYTKWGLDSIAMAPFCKHDCLHIHWRWGPSGEKAVHGWGPSGPYSESAAPLVPSDQEVTVQLVSDHEFQYTATVNTKVLAGNWQVVMHHGMGYAVATGWKAVAAMKGVYAELIATKQHVFEALSDTDEGWALFYWHLRWRKGLLDAKPWERLDWDPGARDF